MARSWIHGPRHIDLWMSKLGARILPDYTLLSLPDWTRGPWSCWHRWWGLDTAATRHPVQPSCISWYCSIQPLPHPNFHLVVGRRRPLDYGGWFIIQLLNKSPSLYLLRHRHSTIMTGRGHLLCCSIPPPPPPPLLHQSHHPRARPMSDFNDNGLCLGSTKFFEWLTVRCWYPDRSLTIAEKELIPI